VAHGVRWSAVLSYLVVALVAGVLTAAITPAVIGLARRLGAVDVPSDPRKVHREPVPTLGGLAIVAGFLGALGVARLLPDFAELFRDTSEPIGLLVGVGVIAVIGLVDDLRPLPPSVKLAGQIVAAMGPVLFGIQIVYVWVPGLEIITLAPDLGFPLTIVAMLAMINAVNLIDGLDGLAAGVVAIAGLAFFTYIVTVGVAGREAVPTSAPLVAALLVGVAVGFLVHNFHPARIFMGDTGSMTLGLLLASAGISYVGRTPAPSATDFAASVPLIMPALVLAIPFVDTAFAIARRAYRRQSIAVADKEHLHHLLIAFGHSHRRAVLVLWYWSAVMAFSAVAWSLVDRDTLLAGTAVTVVVGTALTALGVHAREVEPAGEPAREDVHVDVG
jgi:UDP-GlcNAc:undecaprenyl-phosphate/decaprenyl-phosphate GlcNAc-1-phosphate transferase